MGQDIPPPRTRNRLATGSKTSAGSPRGPIRALSNLTQVLALGVDCFSSPNAVTAASSKRSGISAIPKARMISPLLCTWISASDDVRRLLNIAGRDLGMGFQPGHVVQVDFPLREVPR